MSYFFAAEFHDGHGVSGLAVVRQNEFGHPKIVGADDSTDLEALFIRLNCAAALDVLAAANALARLRIFEHRVFAIDLMLGLKIPGIGSQPMPIQEDTYLVVFHAASPRSSSFGRVAMPARAAQRLRRLAKGAQESAPHAVSIGKSRFPCHHIDGK